jgi:uncharacterized pyridoxamine 5'-phosphate oxidase family protein
MEIADFAEIEAEFSRRVAKMIWCSAATVDGQGRPRSRILHPLWEGATGWICTHRTSFKHKHLARNPFMSLAYITDLMQPVYVDVQTAWEADLAEKRRVWDFFKSTPEPLGFDPAQDFIAYDHPNFGLLKLMPWRIALVSFPAPSHEEGQRIWRARPAA